MNINLLHDQNSHAIIQSIIDRVSFAEIILDSQL